MFREGRSVCELAAVAVDDRLAYLGFHGPHSSVAVFKRETMRFVGLLTRMCGSAGKLLALGACKKLVCFTSAGHIYIWDTSEKAVEHLIKISTDPLTQEGFIHPDARVHPVAKVTPPSLGECIDVDYLPGTSTLLSLGPTGVLTFYDLATGTETGSCHPDHDEGMRALCLRVNTCLATFRDRKGYWVTIGFNKGRITVVFLPVIGKVEEMDGEAGSGVEVDTTDLYSISRCTGERSDVKCLAYRQRSSSSTSMTVVAGCSDGAVRCFVFKLAPDVLHPHKSATYVHCRGAKKGTITHLISGCSHDGSPYVVSLCKMKLPHDFYTTPLVDSKQSLADSSTFCTEVILQILLPDQCKKYEVLVQLRDMVSDIKAGVDGSSFLLTTFDDVYVVRRSESENGWLKPKKLVWQTPENLKLLSKVW
ncbi:lactase-phlorizin hydrolase, putative [Babesia ovata]|uniref:Lactase-phlorizin hydrolase, putative n=1 Tax=Babesia ovata TaxID=189622 RepID=A0A2H6KDQ9_9APIC|nr:lactase-phlorizin hydrolase, putative [Babesia ovata]GBE61126.1 lactase-phlorizin hydrolase, putative [Babesia ovata]